MGYIVGVHRNLANNGRIEKCSDLSETGYKLDGNISQIDQMARKWVKKVLYRFERIILSKWEKKPHKKTNS